MNSSSRITILDVECARKRIAAAVIRTPVVRSAALSTRTGNAVYLKLEHFQTTGSFKIRGAVNAVSKLNDEQRRNGVIGVSTGNHGRSLAFAASQSGVRCIIAMSRHVPLNKVNGIKMHGADVRISGHSQDDAQIEVDRLVREEGLTMLPPFDHIDIIAGQGTLGLELLEQLPTLDAVVVPVSGGGLISGMAVAMKAKKSGLRVIGVSMERGAAMHTSLNAGQPVLVEELPTLADSLCGGIGLNNRYTFEVVRELVDDFILVSEDEIAAAIRHAYWSEGLIIEGSGSVGIAAVLSGRLQCDAPTAIVVSGGNIGMKLHYRIISGENVVIDKDRNQ